MEKITMQDVEVFYNLIKDIPLESIEIGMCYKTEFLDKNGQCIVKEGEIPFKNKEKLRETYKKVISIKETTVEEKEQAQKGRNFFKAALGNIFEDKKKRQIVFLLLGILGTYHICQKNLLPFFLCLTAIVSLKIVKPHSKEQVYSRENFMEELNALGLGSLLYDTEKKEDISLYVKRKMKNCLVTTKKNYSASEVLEILKEVSLLLKFVQYNQKQTVQILTFIIQSLTIVSQSLKVSVADLKDAIKKIEQLKRECAKSKQDLLRASADLQESLQEVRTARESLLKAVEKSRSSKLKLKPSLQM